MSNNELVTKKTYSLESSANDIITDALNETSSEEMKKHIDRFNLELTKKNMLRMVMLNNVLDAAQEEVFTRLMNSSDDMSNKELLEVINTFQTSMEKTSKNMEKVDELPMIELRQQNVNINVDNTLDRDSKNKVINVIKELLKNTARPNNSEENIIEVESVEEE
jgi:hypothetical protein